MKFIRIIKVNLNIPKALTEVGLKFLPKDTLKIEGYTLNVAEILQLVQDGNES